MIGVGIIMMNAFAGIFYLLIGIAIFSSGIKTVLCIQRSGSDYLISVPFFEKEKLYGIQDKINQALATDVDKTDLSLYHNKIADK
ncbi:hypothetical protein NGF69_16670 [Enterococcus casseliflavus]|nr:hypothetical protein [Enterococcus casseliflavus]